MKPTTPTEFLKDVLDYCPETRELLAIADVQGKEKGTKHLTLIVRGKTTAWKYVIQIEEMDPAKLNAKASDELICEGCGAKATGSDTEGVPLCDGCAEAAKDDPQEEPS